MKKWLNKLLIITFIAFTLISPIQVQAAGKNRYYAIALADPNSMMTSYQIFKIDDNTKINSYEKYTNFKGNRIDMPKSDEYVKYKWPNIPYSSESSETATDKDYEQADAIMAEATNQINTLINWLDRWSSEGLVSGYKNNVGELYSDISALFAGGSAEIAGTNFVVDKPSDKDGVVEKYMKKVELSNSPFKGLDSSDFIVIKPENLDSKFENKDSKITILTRLPKGYSDVENAQKFYVKDGITGYPYLLLSDLTATIANAYKEKLTFEDFTVVSSTAQMMDEMFGGFTTNVLNFLGFDEPQELVFNQGERQTGYYLGLMPNSWWSSVNQFFWVAEIIAILILFISVINMILKQNLATISPTIRNSLKDSIAQLAIAILLLMAYVPIFYIMAKVNVLLVDLFESFAVSLGFNNSTPNMNWLLKFIMLAINMGLVIKLNIDYFVRSVMIGFLHATAPIFISSIAMGPTGKKMFNSWIREMTGSIFMQAFNALILAIMMTTIGNGVGSHWWHTQAMVFMLSSLNTWFRNLIGVGDSIASIGGQVKQQADRGWDQAKKTGAAVVGAAAGAASVGSGVISDINAQKSIKSGQEARRIESGGIVANTGTGSDIPDKSGNAVTPLAQKPENQTPKQALESAQASKANVDKKVKEFVQETNTNNNANKSNNERTGSGVTTSEATTSESKSENNNSTSDSSSTYIDVATLMEQNEEAERRENEADSQGEEKPVDLTTPTRGNINGIRLAKEPAKSVGNGTDENKNKHNAGSKVDISNAETTSEGSKQNDVPSKESSIKEAENRKMYEERIGVVNNETSSASQVATSQESHQPSSTQTTTTQTVSTQETAQGTSVSQENPQVNTVLPSSNTNLSSETPIETVSTDQRIDIPDEVTTSESSDVEISNEDSSEINKTVTVDTSEEVAPEKEILNNFPSPVNIESMTTEQMINSVDETTLTSKQKETFNDLKQKHQEATTNVETAQNAYVQELQKRSSDEAKKARNYGNLSRGLNAFSQSMLKSSLQGTGLDAVVNEFGKEKTDKYRKMSNYESEYDHNIGKAPGKK